MPKQPAPRPSSPPLAAAGSPLVEQELSRWEIFCQLVKFCGECCWVICPPVPELVARKLAFHPPPRGLTYTVRLRGEDGRQQPKNAKELLGKEFELQLTSGILPLTTAEQLSVMETVQPFVVTTMFHNHLIAARIRPSTTSSRTSPPFHSTRSNVEQVILFSQPNSSDLGHMLHPAGQVFQRMADDLGVDVYAYDYSGYGFSTGSASERNVYADVQAVYDYIRRTRPSVRIVLVGFSMGTTASIHLAAQKPEHLAGVVLLAAFFSGLSLFRRQKNPHKAVDGYCDRFRNIDRIHEIAVPVLLIHGASDELVPIEHSQEMFKILQKPVAPLYVYGANHSLILGHPFTNLRLIRFLLTETELGPFLATTTAASTTHSSSR